MIEQNFFKSSGNLLAHQTVVPPNDSKTTGVIFVHAANGNRLGPHRMFVQLAERLNQLGFCTLRFDFAGCGDSTGKSGINKIQNEINDLLAAVSFFKNQIQVKSISLFGISRGARIIFETLCKYKLDLLTAVLLSAPAPTGKAALKSSWFRIKEYLRKFENPENIWKLLTAKADFKQIAKTLTTAWNLKNRYKTLMNTSASNCPLLFIYAENDPIRPEAQKIYRTTCRKNNLEYHSKIIKNANHSFFHYLWKEQIIELTSDWMLKTSGME